MRAHAAGTGALPGRRALLNAAARSVCSVHAPPYLCPSGYAGAARRASRANARSSRRKDVLSCCVVHECRRTPGSCCRRCAPPPQRCTTGTSSSRCGAQRAAALHSTSPSPATRHYAQGPGWGSAAGVLGVGNPLQLSHPATPSSQCCCAQFTRMRAVRPQSDVMCWLACLFPCRWRLRALARCPC